MTNTQLAVLLRSYCMQIGGAVEALKDELPQSMKVEYFNLLNEKGVDYPALHPLRQILNDLERAIETLEAAGWDT